MNLNGTVSPNYRYSTQGQENQIDTKWSSYRWRNYDAGMARFFNVDPLSEKYAYQSHYNFAENRVIDARELEGLEAKLIKDADVNIQVSNNPFGPTVKYTPAEYELKTNVIQGSFTNQDVQQKLSTVENNFKSQGFNLTIVQDSNATYTIDMTFSGRSVVVNNSDGTTTMGTVLGDAPQGNPITATVNAKNGNSDTITHEIGHTFGLSHIWESNSGVSNTSVNINNMMNSYENPTTPMKGLGNKLNTNQIQIMDQTIKANSFRLKNK